MHEMNYDIIRLVDLFALDIELVFYLQMIGISFIALGSMVYQKITCTSPGLQEN